MILFDFTIQAPGTNQQEEGKLVNTGSVIHIAQSSPPPQPEIPVRLGSSILLLEA